MRQSSAATITSHRRLLDVLPVKIPVQYSSLEGPVALGYLESVYPEEASRLRDWTMKMFSPKQGDDAVHLVHGINSWIYHSIRYRRRTDRGVQTPLKRSNSNRVPAETWPHFYLKSREV